MINYSKVRESVEKNSSKKSLSKGLTINKSHTSSINIKLSQDATSYQNMKIPLKAILKEKCQPYLQTHSKHLITSYAQPKKYTVKLQSNQKENQVRCKQPFDVTIIRPFQQTNRYLQTQRLNKQHSKHNEHSLSKKSNLKLKTQYIQSKLKTQYKETSAEKYRKEASTRNTNDSSKFVRVSLNDITILLGQLSKTHKQVQEIKRELSFFRGLAIKQKSNSVIAALII